MEKLFFIILIELISIGTAFCSPVDTTDTRVVATNFYLSMATHSNQQRVRSLASKQIVIELVHQEYEDVNNQIDSEPYYYVYNVQGDNGFIIVSADDDITPILAYSFVGKYDVKASLPPAFVDWLGNYKKQIKQIKQIKQNISVQLNAVKSIWARNLAKRYNTNSDISNYINPLFDRDSIYWDQLCNYNINCPYDSRCVKYCNHTPIGCVAVAMGQIMRFWKYPKNSNTIPGYSDDDNKDENGSIISNSNYGYMNGVNSTTYNWTQIPNKLTSESTDIQKNSISQFLYNCALSVKMNFGPSVSGANDIEAFNSFKNYFNYYNSIQYVKKNDYSNINDWINTIKTELNSNRPVYYRADDTSGDGGHAFVCDGYDSNNMFHFNWGWGGAANQTYCYIYSLIPDGSGYNFSNNQEAIIGIVPDKADLIPINPKLSTYTAQAGSTILASCDEDNSGPIAAGTHTLSIYLSTDNVLTVGENGDICLGNIDVSGVSANSCSLTFSKTIQIPSNTLTGNYYIFFKSDSNNAIDEFNEENNSVFTQLSIMPRDPQTLTDIDGNIYNTIKIGTQTWMVENLKTTHYRNGDAILNITDNLEWTAYRAGAWCDFNNDAYNGIKYGKMYNWYVIGDSRGITPVGWHVPTDTEWTTLTNYLIANGFNYDGTTSGNKIAKSLATKTDWNFYNTAGVVGNDLTTNNITGFSALPSGLRGYKGVFGDFGNSAWWWSSTETDFWDVWCTYLFYGNRGVLRVNTGKTNGFNIRCILDNPSTEAPKTEINNYIKIYPNPTSESFHVSGLNGIATLKLTDFSGKELLVKQVSNNETISICSLPKGLYVVRIFTMNEVIEMKILKK